MTRNGMQVLPSVDAVEGARAFDAVLTKILAGQQAGNYEPAAVERAWAAVQSGDWDRLGIAESEGGFGLTLRDLVEVAQVLGRHIVPAPVTTSIVLRALTEAGGAGESPLTMSIARRSKADESRVPYGGFPSVEVVNLSQWPDSTATQETFAPSLQLLTVRRAVNYPLEPSVRRWVSVLWAAETLGAARHLMDAAVEYAKIREQFGQPIGRFQSIKHLLADCQVAYQEALTATVWAANDAHILPGALRLVFERCMFISETAGQVHGAIGMTWELGHHFYTRHIVMLRDLVEDLLVQEGQPHDAH